MRLRAPITASALMAAGLLAAGSATQEQTPAPKLAATTTTDTLSRTVGLVAAQKPTADRRFGSADPLPDTSFASGLPLSSLVIGQLFGKLDIPEIALAAYRNAELRLAASQPGCGLGWSLLAGIGRIESGHAGGGNTDPGGTTVTPIVGPALDGHLPGNEVIHAADGTAVRALGPMQFLPGTWDRYATDGNGDGNTDPHNVFDSTLAAGKYLCSGGLDLRDPAQQLRAVLRYNNSVSYATDVLGWAAAYQSSGARPAPADPTAVSRPGALAPNTIPIPDAPTRQGPPQVTAPEPEPMIAIPGLPPIPCGIFCPKPPPAQPPQHAAPAQKPATLPWGP